MKNKSINTWIEIGSIQTYVLEYVKDISNSKIQYAIVGYCIDGNKIYETYDPKIPIIKQVGKKMVYATENMKIITNKKTLNKLNSKLSQYLLTKKDDE